MAAFRTVDDAVKHFQTSKRVKVVGNGANHNIPIGRVYNVANCIKSANQLYITIEGYPQYQFRLTDVEPACMTKDELQEQLNTAVNDVHTAEQRLSYMNDSGAKMFDEKEFKVWRTLALLDEHKGTRLDRAKAIAELINN